MENAPGTDNQEKDRGSQPDFTVEQIRVHVRQRKWVASLSIHQPVHVSRLETITQQWLQQTPSLEKVDLICSAADGEYCLSAILTAHWNDIHQLIHSINPAFAKGITWETQGTRLHLVFEEQRLWQQALDHNLCETVEKWIYDQYRLHFAVFACHQEPLQHKPMIGAITAAQSNVVAAEAPAPRKKRNGRENNGQSKNIASDEMITPIQDLQEGLRFVIEGCIVDVAVKDLKGERKLVSYSVTDFTDTISVKRFDEPQFSVGDWVKIAGGVRYDNFDREVVLFADVIEAIESRARKDQAPEKRIELHLHTVMSTLDGLTDIKQLFKAAARMGHTCLAITDHGNLQAFPEAFEQGKSHDIKVIYGVEAYLVDQPKQARSNHIILLASNQQGLRNLYQLVSQSYLDNFYRTPRITRSALIEHREGLIIGSACEKGELIQAYLEGTRGEQWAGIAEFYDYLEIQPTGNNAFLVRDGVVKSMDEVQEINRAVYELGKQMGKPVVATGDVHFLEPHHEVFRRILQAGKGFEDAENQAPLYYRTTEEMLAEFEYMGEEAAYEVVVRNTALIAERCEALRPVPKGHYFPRMEGAKERLISIVWQQAGEKYGDPLPEIVKTRLERELYSITTHGFSDLYLVAYDLVKKSNSDGYVVGSRGSVGSSMAAYVVGITEVNPMVPHYRCACGYSEFVEDGSATCGPDLPVKDCPQCGTAMDQDGFDIPFETFLGFEGDKDPDIDLNFSGDYQSRAHQYVEELFGKENVFRAGTISTIAEKTAFGFVKKYEEAAGFRYRRAEIDRLVKGISGIKRTTGQHPGGLMIVPPEYDVHDFTPLQHPADDVKSDIITTHFDYHALSGVLVKLDVLGHDDPTMIKALEDATGFHAARVRLNEPQTMSLFSGVDALKVKPEDIKSKVGTYGIPEFGTRFVRQMLEATRPSSFSELVRISGLSHGTDVWVNNAADLIKEQTATLNDVIATRDDIMTFLIYQGLDKKESFDIMERVRKGKGLSEGQMQYMTEKEVPNWYIESCNKIKYMFPKAHAVAYVTMAYRIAFFKVYYPLAFYSGFFSIRAGDFDDVMVLGYDEIRRRLEEIEDMGVQAPAKEKNLITILELALEMHARGFKFYPIDLYRSDANRFEILSDGLLLPFSALGGVGETAAKNIVAAREEKEFLSVEDLQRRGKVNKAVTEILAKTGCLDGLPQSSQVSLFG